MLRGQGWRPFHAMVLGRERRMRRAPVGAAPGYRPWGMPGLNGWPVVGWAALGVLAMVALIRLHTFGVYFLWLEFFGAFGRRALHDPFYVPFVLVCLAAMALRLGARWRAVREASLSL
jgi:hypothetical protein